ncbi:MAG: hypothetical protein B7Z62_02075 [Deltaproteobacteria bacterium 37-65-8]|nr:MAG: hypothetical protein B7Z62_02075 [Deltaproteobacteria bacterium 37-65-8]
MTNMSATEETTVTGTYLANLSTLETALMGTSANLDTAKAGVWEHNADEHKDRERLYRYWRLQLCDFFGVPPGPKLTGQGNIELVV